MIMVEYAFDLKGHCIVCQLIERGVCKHCAQLPVLLKLYEQNDD